MINLLIDAIKNRLEHEVFHDLLVQGPPYDETDSDINGFAPIFPDTCYHLTHYWPAAADIPVASDNPVHYADA
ncbi:hypothetical protein ACD916_22475, partial [Escherichia coli]